MKKLLSGLILTALMFTLTAPVYATDISSNNTVETIVPANTFSVIVPTNLPIKVSSIGEVSVNSSNTITNKSFTSVEITEAKITMLNGWTLKDYNTDFTKSKVNTKEFGFQLNGENVEENGNADITVFPTIRKDDSLNFTYNAKIAPQKNDISQQIASVMFTFSIVPEPPHATGNPIDKKMMRESISSLRGTITFSTEPYSGKKGIPINGTNKKDATVFAVKSGQDATIYSVGGGGSFSPEDATEMFKGYAASTLNLYGLDTSQTTNMSNMFVDLNTGILDLRGFDTSHVTNMRGMFSSESLHTIKISSFDTSNVTDMSMMFNGIGFFSHELYGITMKYLDLSNFDTSKVTTMEGMFGFSNIGKIKLNSFNTTNVKDMRYMFGNSYSTDLDLSSFDLSGLDLFGESGMFKESSAKAVYCRTQKDLDIMKNSTDCSATGFVVGKP